VGAAEDPRADERAWAVHLPAGVRDVEGALLADAGLPARWLARWREQPSRPQLCDVDGTWLTAEELEQRTRAAALRLLGAGLVAGDRLLLCAPTSADVVIAYVAALRAGLVVVPVNPAYTNAEVARIVRDARPAAAAVDDERLAAWVRAAAERPIPVFPVELDLTARLAGGVPRFAGTARGFAGAAAGAEAQLDRAVGADVALLVYTSGTTGRAKGAPLTHANLLSSATAVNLAWRWQADDALLLTLPLFHLHGLGVGLNGSLCAGAAVVLRPSFDAGDVAACCARDARPSPISLFFGVPAMYQRLAASGRLAALARLRLLVSGSAPLQSALAEHVAELVGEMPLERYGMTETVMLTSNPYAGERRPGTVGLALPGVAVRVEDAGEVQVRGPNVIAGYYGDTHADREAFTADGWFRTGDLGELGADGYLTLVGRSKDLIITGGYNVHPQEVEEALEAHPAVREAAVIGRASELWGEELTAVVVAERALTARELREHAAGLLAPYKVPKTIEFAGELPRNPLGKLLRNELR
jgi:malonyl-CoA/methylmalonyl-CoA synthetase